MRVGKQIRYCISVVLALGLAALGYKSAKASSWDVEPTVGVQTPHALPIPAAGPLAGSKSLTQIGVPVEATRAAVPADNPQAPAKVALGEKLFFDGRLSADGTVACSTCHDPALAFTDGRPVSIGVKGRAGQRNAPTILNALYNTAQFWDGRAKTLEEQAALPIMNPSEMGQPRLDAAVAQIATLREYEEEFRRVFGRPINGTDLVRAIASYERTQFSFDSPFDYFMAGDHTAITDSAELGWDLFNAKARDAEPAQHAHYGPIFSRRLPSNAMGRGGHYNHGDGLKDPWLDRDMQPLALSESEIDDTVDFLATLTSAQYQQLGAKELARQRGVSRMNRPQRDTARASGPKPVQPKASRSWVAAQPETTPK